MCLVMLSDEAFKMRVEIPPHQLQFDCQGSITLEYPAAIIEAGAIKSSSMSMYIVGPDMSDYLLTCCRLSRGGGPALPAF